MKKIMTAMLISVFLFSGCSGQQKENIEQKSIQKQPETNIIVNKEYDENGNIMKYDSTYSYYYSNIENNQAIADSILNNFINHFNQSYSFSNNPFFNDMFFQDSLLDFDFYKKDFFKNRFLDNWQHMDKLFIEMDSTKNSFFNIQFQDNIKKE